MTNPIILRCPAGHKADRGTYFKYAGHVPDLEDEAYKKWLEVSYCKECNRPYFEMDCIKKDDPTSEPKDKVEVNTPCSPQAPDSSPITSDIIYK